MNAQPVRRTSSILIYSLPVLADMLVAQFLFINSVRLAHAGASASVVANTVAMWSIVYLLACPAVGRFVTVANAAHMMAGSMAGMALLGGLFTVVEGVAGVYILMALAGVAAAFFFPPFQVFMKAVDRVEDKPLTYSTGLYTFAWSLGFAIGPFIAGFLMGRGPSGWKQAWWFAVAVALMASVGVFSLRHRTRGPSAPAFSGIEVSQKTRADYSHQTDLAWMGWIGGGVGMILITLIRAVFPVRAEAVLHLTQGLQGLLFFLLSLSQAVTGLILCRSRYWMYRPAAMAGFGLFGLVGMLAFGFGESLPSLVAGALMFGVYSGSFFFYLVFHALVHPRRSSQYVAINESVVGICGMAGAMLGGWVADRFGFGMLYSAGMALLLLTLGFQWIVHQRFPAR
jgi:predicted MFS family arabinose efflux permease